MDSNDNQVFNYLLLCLSISILIIYSLYLYFSYTCPKPDTEWRFIQRSQAKDEIPLNLVNYYQDMFQNPSIIEYGAYTTGNSSTRNIVTPNFDNYSLTNNLPTPSSRILQSISDEPLYNPSRNNY